MKEKLIVPEYQDVLHNRRQRRAKRSNDRKMKKQKMEKMSRKIELQLPEPGREPFGITTLHASDTARELFQRIGGAVAGEEGGAAITALVNVLIAASKAAGIDKETVAASMIATWDQYDANQKEEISILAGL